MKRGPITTVLLIAIATGCTAPPPKRPGASVLSPGDAVRVRIVNVPTPKDFVVMVDGAGQVRVPLLGGQAASGRTPAQLAGQLTAAYREFSCWVTNIAVTVERAEQSVGGDSGKAAADGVPTGAPQR